MSKLQIKNMVCPGCIIAVENGLDKMKVSAIEVRLGKVLLNQEFVERELSADRFSRECPKI